MAATGVVRRGWNSVCSTRSSWTARPGTWSRVVTVHPLGSCQLGRNEREGVVDSYGRVFGHPGLLVVEGSIMPDPVGPNPSNTIAALAHRGAEQVIREAG